VDEIQLYIKYTPVASVIFAITVALSLLAFYNEEVYSRLILNPFKVAKNEDTHTVLTSGFIHKDWTHLFFNMFSFYFFAFPLELRIGHWQFALLYMVSLVLSDVPTIVKHRDDFWYRSLGASGAISAAVFSFIMFEPMARMGLMFIPVPIPAILFGVLYLVYCVYASRKNIGAINHDAHFYGALCGIVITIILYPGVVHLFFEQIAKWVHGA
jgi:membrane associated rhomboid family serine protease